MKRYLLPLLIVAFAILGGAGGFWLGGYVYDNPPAPAGIDPIDRGEAVPDFTLSDSAGEPRRLSEWHGRLIVVNYWASWCPPCIEEMPMLDDYANAHAAQVAVVGIAEDDPEAVAAFLDRHPVDYPILIGTRRLAGSSMQLGNSRGVLPFTALIGPDGTLLERRAGLLDEALLDAWRDEYAVATDATAN